MMRSARYLLAVIDHGSFTRAAETLNVSQPALSQQIRFLEDTLGAKLLDRSGRTVRPTDAGQAYIRHLKAALQNLDAAQRAVHDVGNLTSGVLRVAFLPLFTTYLVGPVVQAFRKRYPDIDLTIDILPQAVMERALLDDQYDVGVGLGDLASLDVATEPLHDTELCVVVGKDHPLAGRRKLASAKLSGLDLALLDGAFVTRAPINQYLKANKVQPRIALESNSVDALVAIVQSTLLATILPAATARNLPGFSAIRLDPPFATRTTSALLRRDGYRSAGTKAFLALLKERNWAAEPRR
ncbi:MAG: transcriptional regulator CynR [Afipia sp.]|mgnify:CR=1 FL=1|nr:transcriptional regulator CynR [Afipia sp.]OJW63232.1 MAG: transcriptional regulator CynR [Afipia sp. 64-13]